LYFHIVAYTDCGSDLANFLRVLIAFASTCAHRDLRRRQFTDAIHAGYLGIHRSSAALGDNEQTLNNVPYYQPVLAYASIATEGTGLTFTTTAGYSDTAYLRLSSGISPLYVAVFVLTYAALATFLPCEFTRYQFAFIHGCVNILVSIKHWRIDAATRPCERTAFTKPAPRHAIPTVRLYTRIVTFCHTYRRGYYRRFLAPRKRLSSPSFLPRLSWSVLSAVLSPSGSVCARPIASCGRRMVLSSVVASVPSRWSFGLPYHSLF